MISLESLSNLTPFTLLLWPLSALGLAGTVFFIGRLIGYTIRTNGKSLWSQDLRAKRLFESLTGMMVCFAIQEVIEIRTGFSIKRGIHDMIAVGLCLIGFIAGYAHDHREHRRKEQEREKRPEVTNEKKRRVSMGWSHQHLMNNETTFCDCWACERRHRRTARKRR